MPPVLRCRTLASYVLLRAEGSESVPALDCIFYTVPIPYLGVSMIYAHLTKKEKWSAIESAYISPVYAYSFVSPAMCSITVILRLLFMFHHVPVQIDTDRGALTKHRIRPDMMS